MEVEGVNGVVLTFCLFDRRVVGWAALSVSEAEGLESLRTGALRFLDFAGVLGADAGVVLGSAGQFESSTLRSDSAASLAEERVTLEDMCENGDGQRHRDGWMGQ